ncbi:MAG: acyl-CoA/acyl-ACP dehydrogenase [Halioglobus sp.]|nr:acyl-CoA/acyl-ACP dehydrogenase [Halioglobus sp.]
MDLLPTEEQQQIIDSAASFLHGEFPVERLLQLQPEQPAVDAAQLQQIATLGWFGIGLDENDGGVGYGVSEEALLFIELGRALMPPSLLGATLAARMVTQAGPADALTPILEGHARVAIATARPGAPCTIGAAVSGELLVFEPQDADYILIASPAGAALLRYTDLGTLTPATCIDPTLAAVQVSATDVNAAAFVPTARDNLFQRGALLTAALSLGIAEATLERSVAYAKEREQFGQPIGSFQSIKHYCADMAVRCESVRAMVYHTSLTLGASAGLYDLSTTKALATEAAQSNANTAVQIHGGMGYTQEMDIHLFVKRAQVLATLFGGERYHLATLLAEPRPDRAPA